MKSLSESIADYLETGKYERKLSPDTIKTYQIVHDLLQSAYAAYAPSRRNVLGDIVVLELLFSTGLRVSELYALSKETFLLENDELRLLVNGKGNKERTSKSQHRNC